MRCTDGRRQKHQDEQTRQTFFWWLTKLRWWLRTCRKRLAALYRPTCRPHSYLAERIFRFKVTEPARTRAPFARRSLINFQHLSICAAFRAWLWGACHQGACESSSSRRTAWSIATSPFVCRVFLVDYRVMDHIRQFELVGFRRVCVEDHFAIGLSLHIERPKSSHAFWRARW